MRIVMLIVGRTVVTIAMIGAVGGRGAVAHPITLAFLALEACWSLAEGVLARGELLRTREQRFAAAQLAMSDDERWFLFSGKRYALVNLVYQAIVLVVFAWRAHAIARSIGPMTMLGLFTYGTGAAIRGSAMAMMGARFKSWSVAREPGGIEARGAYRVVRHPAYLGLLLIALSIPMIFVQPWLLVLVPLPLGAIAARVEPEERLLRAAYGDEYAGYAARTRARLLPGIW